ncbi:metal-dependent hydrolase family protein [Ruegeria profundi]|uniref:metal-dependent hydrolase family protein n=1 Tax=Ruegeria profundi TaxID=1685378 RepID=UPI00082CD8B3|nr:amidohydrolase family protein [Ruegeria profundi]
MFDGVADSLAEGRNILVEGNLISAVGDADLTSEGAEVIDCDGRTLMPGLIDAHSHIYMNMPGGVGGMESGTWDQIGARAASQATEYLYNGFTSIRELGGGGSGVKKTVDEGLIEGPRIYPGGAFISQTSGHADLRYGSQRNPNLPPYPDDNNAQRLGVTIVADGPDAVLAATRQNLSQGASQIKLMAGGGVASILDPLHTLQFLPEEIEMAVRAAADWDTYVAVHVFSDEGIRRSVDAGVRSIEHGFFASRETLQLMKDRDVFLVAQMTGISPYLELNPGLQSPENQAKLALATDLSKDFVQNVKAIQPKMAFQSDIVFATGEQFRAQMDYEKWFHADLFGNHAMLVAATSGAGELLAYSGLANPYLEGPLGVIEEGAYADILIVEGNPLEDISVIGGNEKWYDAEPRARDIPTLRVIMKDGVIYKNTLE